MAFFKSALLVVLTAVTLQLLPLLLRKKVPSELVFGSCVQEFSAVEKAYRKLFEDGEDHGSSFSLYHKGEKVCDMWGGYSDEEIQRPWMEDTMSVWFSSTKGLAAISLMTLHSSGHLDYEKPVSHYWPEFAKNGKEKMTVEQLVSHAGGLAALDADIDNDMILTNHKAISEAFEDQKPNWEPGTKHGYHALQFGILVDQLIQRVDPEKRPLQVFFKEEIAEPLGVDFYIGTPLSEHHRIARYNYQIPFTSMVSSLLSSVLMAKMYYQLFMNPAPLAKRSFNNPPLPQEKLNWPEIRQVPQSSAISHGEARAVAKIYAIIANGGKEGDFTLLDEKSLALFDKSLCSGLDEILKVNMTFGYGLIHYQVGDENVIGHPGYGGQQGWADRKNNLAYGYVTNYPNIDIGYSERRHVRMLQAIYKSISTLG